MQSLPRSMRERAVASLAWRRTSAAWLKGYREYPGSYAQEESHSDSRPEKRAPERLPKAGGHGVWSPSFAQKYMSFLHYTKTKADCQGPCQHAI